MAYTFEAVSSWIGFIGDVQHYDFSIDVSSEVHSEPKKKKKQASLQMRVFKGQGRVYP